MTSNRVLRKKENKNNDVHSHDNITTTNNNDDDDDDDDKDDSKNNDNDDESVKDEQVRRDINILSARLYDLRERFMKIIHNMNKDAMEFFNEISDTDETPVKKSKQEVTDDEENSDSTMTSSNQDSDDEDEGSEEEINNDNADDEEEYTSKSKIKLQIQQLSMRSILQRQARDHEYFKYIIEYPKIMKYLMSDDLNHTSVPLRHLEPFIKQHVHKNPNGRVYDKVNEQIREIRLNYLKNCI